MQLKGLLYRKLKELGENRKKVEKMIEEGITRETRQIIDELESFMTKDVKKIERTIDNKFDQILKNLQALNRLNKSIIKQNQTLINLLRKRRKIAVSI